MKLLTTEPPHDYSHLWTFLIGIFVGVLLTISVASFGQDGSERTLSGKRDQLFRVINEVRREKGYQPLNYQADDQPLATLRAKAIARVFRPDTTTCAGEVILQGSYGYVVSQIQSGGALAYQYDPDISWASVGIEKVRGTYYVIVRIF